MQAARHAAKQLAQRGAVQLKSVRGMASDASSEKAHMDEALKEMSKWRTVTYVAVPTCIAVAAWDLTHIHEHHEEVPDYPYMRIRTKEFPWGPCGLFEMHCPDAEAGEEE
ncbi:hypothetical protein ABBQ32_011766 [Trebouxia sp. C0010 RCD-2024]